MASQPHTGDKPADSVEVLIFETPVHLSKDADETPGQPFGTEMEQEEELGELEEDTGTMCWGALKRMAKADLDEKSKAWAKGAAMERGKGALSGAGDNFLAKFQISTGFFQHLHIVAGLPHIAWPPMFSWLAFSVSFPFSLNFSGVATSRSAYLVSTIVAPLMLLLVARRFMRSPSAWKERYVANWSQFQWQLVEVWIIGSLLWVLLTKVLEDMICMGD